MKNLKKMSLANAQGKLSRKELKTIMAGSSWACGTICFTNNDCGGPYYCICWNNYCQPTMY